MCQIAITGLDRSTVDTCRVVQGQSSATRLGTAKTARRTIYCLASSGPTMGKLTTFSVVTPLYQKANRLHIFPSQRFGGYLCLSFKLKNNLRICQNVRTSQPLILFHDQNQLDIIAVGTDIQPEPILGTQIEQS
jgi:hypothetical protein